MMNCEKKCLESSICSSRGGHYRLYRLEALAGQLEELNMLTLDLDPMRIFYR